jgi:hypothetical protein
MQLQMAPDERELLEEILSERLTSLRIEIRHTDHAAFRRRLKHRAEQLEGLLDRIRVVVGDRVS